MPKSLKSRAAKRKEKARSRTTAQKKKPTSPTTAVPVTKQSRAIAMLRSNMGASVASLMEVTGWQQHSVRGFLAGVVRKRLKLRLESSKSDGCRTYRIVSGDHAGPAIKTSSH